MTSKENRWISPRKERENAIALGEALADEFELRFGPRLTPDELRQAHAEARRLTSLGGRQSRRSAS